MVLFVLLILSLVAFAVVFISVMGIYLLISSCFQKYAPPVRSSGRLKKMVLAEISQQLEKVPDGQKIVDLGSGWGTLLLPLAKKFPQHQFIGLERAFTPFHISCIRARKIPNLQFLREDFFSYNLEQINIVLMFLIGFMMPRVTEKCLKEMSKGAKIYAVRFPLKDVEPCQIIDLGNKMERLYIYEM